MSLETLLQKEGRVAQVNKKRKWVHLKAALLPYMLIFPTFLLFFVFFFIPVLYSLFLSLTEWNGFSENMNFVGFDNYIRLYNDPMFWNAFQNTMYYTLGTVPASLAIALFLSVLISEKVKGFSFLRGAFFMPHVISMVAVSVVWTWIYSPDAYGLFNWFLGFFGVPPQNWLSDPDLAMPALIIMGIWKMIGYNMIIFLAGLKSIPNTIHEAASIDGVGPWTRFRYITLPMLMPSVFFLSVVSVIFSFFQVFDQINVMTQGGPVGSTEVLVTYLYEVGFQEFEVGYASAIAFVLFALIIIITLLQKVFIERKIHY